MEKVTYTIVNSRTGKQVGGVYTQKQRARNQCEKLDLIYGAYVHRIKASDGSPCV